MDIEKGMITATGVLILSAVLLGFIQQVTPKHRRPPCGSYGDLDGDGWITYTDVQMVKNYLAGIQELTDEQLQLADVNGDGVVSIADALLIQQYLVGSRDTFPVCPGA